jgi:hypothetical protein
MKNTLSVTKWQRSILVPALLCAVLSAALVRSWTLSFLFLLPLGFMAGAYNNAGAWLSWAAASALNGIVSAIPHLRSGSPGWGFGFLFFAVMSLGFTWIMAGGSKANIRALYRFIAAGAAGAVMLLLNLRALGESTAFQELVKAQVEMLISMYSSQADAVRSSLLENSLTTENLIGFINQFFLRGGALVSCLLFFFASREAALVLTRLVYKRERGAALRDFHAPSGTIWALSLSLGAVLVFRGIGLAVMETLAWNSLALCGIIYLAQGAGIVLHKLGGRPLVARFIFCVLAIVLVFSPGINALALGVLLLLGIAENWLPLRAAKTDAKGLSD